MDEDEELNGEEGDRLLSSNREDDEEREVGGWSSSSGGGAERPFRLDSDSEDGGSDGEEEREAKGKGKANVMAVEGSQGEWEDSSLDRRGGFGAGQQTGDMSKASKLLGVNVGR